MNEKIVTKSEFDNLYSAIEKILETKVEEIKITNSIPKLDDNLDNNNVFKGKLSVLFVDMRKSTDLTDEVKSKKMVKIYRSFIRMSIQAIRFCGGETRQFAGDGVMGLFKDEVIDGNTVTSSDKAVIAARYIITMMDHCINPLFSNKLSGLTIACGVGICTGDVLVTKVGMRGKEQDASVENEMGLVWTGKTTNYASRYCSLADTGEIFICPKTHKEISANDSWKKSSRTKGTKVFSGFIADKLYLKMSEEINQSPVVHTSDYGTSSFVQEIFEETKDKALLLIDEITKKSAELSKITEDVNRREQLVAKKEVWISQEEKRLENEGDRLKIKKNNISEKEIELYNNVYSLHRKLFSDTYLKDQIIKNMGKDFWLKQINLMYDIGEKLDKSSTDVKRDLSIYLKDIYLIFNMYEDAYNSLCINVQYASWISSSNVREIITRSNHWIKLRDILLLRKSQNITQSLKNDINEVLKIMINVYPSLYN